MESLKYLIIAFLLGGATQAFSQDMFWSFDDMQNPLPIPAECDAKFDEIRGGVFMPTVNEMYEYGMAFLKNPALTVQQQGAYCLLGAALQGDPNAQLEMAKLYDEGRVLIDTERCKAGGRIIFKKHERYYDLWLRRLKGFFKNVF